MKQTDARPTALLLLGPTGAGKTPLGQYAATQTINGIPCHHFDFGAELRRLAGMTTPPLPPPAMRMIQDVLTAGRLLRPEEFALAQMVLEQFLTNLPPAHHLVLNGLPRTIQQAEGIAPIVAIRHLVALEAAPDIILERIRSNRGGDRTGRTDDTPDAVRKRLALYEEQTRPLLAFYQQQHTPVLHVPIERHTQPRHIWKTYLQDHVF